MAWILVGLSLTLLVIAATLNAVFAFTQENLLTAVQLLAFVAFAINIMAVCCLIFLITYYIPRLKRGSTEWSTALFWRFLGISVPTASVAAVLAFVTLVWTAVRMVETPERIVRRPSKAIVISWLTVWGVSTLLQIVAYAFVAWWTKRALYNRSLVAAGVEFGVDTSGMRQSPLHPRPTSGSFRCQDPNRTSPPPTSTVAGISSPLRLSQYGGRGGGATSSLTRLVNSRSFTTNSAKSSFDYATSEAVSIDHPFDHWDTSGVTREVRTTLHSTPPVTRSGLETIPGSRPESPAKPLDGPFLPDSPHAGYSDAATAMESHNPRNSPQARTSLPPSSPPNFSRPTSRQTSQPTVSSAPTDSTLETTSENLIHPLFRPGSTSPAPVTTVGTMVTASPLAGQSITPNTLTRMRRASMPQQCSPLEAPAVTPPEPESNPGTPDAGSPGPSIIEEDELPPVIPGFILSAGQRSSFLEYGKRKSVRTRRSSSRSQGSRLSLTVP